MQEVEMEMFNGLVRVFLRMMYEKNRLLYLHSVKTARIADIISRGMNLDGRMRWMVVTSAKLHDVGKLMVPDDLLMKKGRYKPREMTAMMVHPVCGAEIVSQYFNGNISLEAGEVIFAIRHHHERFDGSGYPSGLVGDNNSIVSQIVGLADFWAALTERRPYRTPCSHDLARRTIEENRNLFHPGIVKTLLMNLDALSMIQYDSD